jgi:hypothetical protein
MMMPAITDGTIEALRGVLGDGKGLKRSPDVLTVAPALTELVATLDDASAGRSALFGADRRSLVADLDACLTRVGKELEAYTSPSLRSLRTGEIANLQATLNAPADCRRLAMVVCDVLAQLRSDGSVEAAWRDVVSAAADPAVSVDDCVLAGDQLRELVRLRGHDWWYMSSRILERAVAGDLAAACRAAVAPPKDDATVAWVAFGNADLDRGYCRVGQVQFFTHKLGLVHIRDGCPALDRPEFERAVELTDEALTFFPEVKDQAHYVWARVELSGPRAHQPVGGRTQPPLEWAREFARSLVEAASYPGGGTEWKLLGGGYVFSESGDLGGGTMWISEDEGEPERFFGNPWDEPTSRHLAELPDAFADALARNDAAARFAVDEVRWHRTVELGDDAAGRLALFVRGFERQWVTGPNGQYKSWEEPVRRHLRDAWASHMVRDAIWSAGLLIHRGARAPDATQRMHAADAEVHRDVERASFSISLSAVIEHAPLVAQDFASGSLERRVLKQIARETRDGDTMRAAWERAASRFDSQLNRAVRQRNRIIHGGSVEQEVAAGVEPFLRQLSAWLVSLSLQAARENKQIEHVLDELRDKSVGRYEHLRGASASAFFGAIS